MQRIYINNRTIKYVSDARDVVKYLPQEELINVHVTGSKRVFDYPSGTYYVEVTNKQKGIYEGNICPICESGEMIDMGGCMTCNSCGSQLKCGL